MGRVSTLTFRGELLAQGEDRTRARDAGDFNRAQLHRIHAAGPHSGEVVTLATIAPGTIANSETARKPTARAWVCAAKGGELQPTRLMHRPRTRLRFETQPPMPAGHELLTKLVREARASDARLDSELTASNP